MGAPQIIWIILTCIGLLVHAALDGEPKTGTYRFGVGFVSALISNGLLWWGGFFG